jgi:hypothetical protein
MKNQGVDSPRLERCHDAIEVLGPPGQDRAIPTCP